MAKPKSKAAKAPAERKERVKLSAQESLKRMNDFPSREEQFVAAVRKNKNRSIPA